VEPDVLVGLGGGSSLDVAKGAAFLLAGGGRMADYWGRGKAKGTLLPIVAVPTTAGTGSEMQSFALIGHRENHQKMACGDPQAAPRVALLDPELTLSMPRAVTACTGLDTLAHALESAVTRAASEVSSIYSEDAFVRVVRSLPVVLSSPKNLGARGDMMLAAAHAGLAIEHSMLGAAHSMANPLTAHHGIAHGQAVGMALPAVVAFNAAEPAAAARYRALTVAAGLCAEDASERDAIAILVARLRDLVAAAGFPTSLAGCGVAAPAAMALAAEAARQWTAQFNPRAVGEAEFRELFAAASAPVVAEEG